MSEAQHTKDMEDFADRHPDGCLNRHLDGSPEERSGNTCSHRWQAYKQMEADKGLYNWTKYESLSKRKTRIPTFAINQGGIFPECYTFTLKQPEANEWDVGRMNRGHKNFWWKCYHPYWHEAHHVVPNSTLRNAIVQFAKGVQKGEELVTTIRGGLLKEKYKMNDQLNMIMLPLDKAVADALKLPRHRQTAAHRNHSIYSKNVQSKLEDIFSALQQELVEHQTPKYTNVKKRIEDLSQILYEQIKTSEAASLDEMDEDEFPLPL